MVQDSSRKRGPRGLASSKAKKVKSEQVDERSESNSPSLLAPEENTESKTIAISGEFDDDDEVGQLIALYETAVEHLLVKDPISALPVLNGTVHEADRILRNTTETNLSYEFHRVYASALLDLSLLQENIGINAGEGTKDFIESSLERCELGLELGCDPGMNALKLTQARCICRQIQHQMRNQDVELNAAKADIETSMRLIDSSFKTAYYRPFQVAQSLCIIQDFADSLLEIDAEGHEKINKWAESYWTRVLTASQEDISALEGCGRVWLSLAQPHLSQLESTSESTKPDPEILSVARSSLETSIELITQAKRCAEKQSKVTGELLCLLAEATISLANTYDDGPTYDELERTTITYLRSAESQEDFVLPERFQEMLG